MFCLFFLGLGRLTLILQDIDDVEKRTLANSSCLTSSGRISVILKSHFPVGRKRRWPQNLGRNDFWPTKFNPKKCAELTHFTNMISVSH